MTKDTTHEWLTAVQPSHPLNDAGEPGSRTLPATRKLIYKLFLVQSTSVIKKCKHTYDGCYTSNNHCRNFQEKEHKEFPFVPLQFQTIIAQTEESQFFIEVQNGITKKNDVIDQLEAELCFLALQFLVGLQVQFLGCFPDTFNFLTQYN